MSVRVNLLPQATRDQVRSARQRNGVLLGFVALLGALGAVHLWGQGRVDDARGDLIAAEQATAVLRGEVAALADYQALEEDRKQSLTWLQTVFAAEYSLADVLQDVATAVPTDTQIDNLTITTLPSEAPAVGLATPLAEFNATGQTVTSHAPGVERLLLEFERVATFRDLAMTSATTDDAGEATTYTVTGRIGGIARTGRYDAGLPEAMR